jgi:microcystin-dependent protein
MSSFFIGEMRTFAFGFAPKFWAQCNGQLLPISQNQALFSLLGTQYGGNGTTNFALPDLRGRTMLGFGSSPGLPGYQIGEKSGRPDITLVLANLPSHTHPVQATVSQPVSNSGGGSDTPLTNIPANTGGQPNYAAPSAASGSLAPPQAALNFQSQAAGGNQPFDNMPPYLVLNTCIATSGIFPSRN